MRSTQTKEAARRDAQTARKRRSRAADAAAVARSISLAIRHLLLLVKCGRRVVCRRGSRVQLMPLPRPQTTRPFVSIRTRWRVARLLRADVGRVQLMLMPLPGAQVCVEWSVCAAVEPADDAAAALHEQKKVASREADAARRRWSRAADATATRSNMCGVVCMCRCRAYRRRGSCTSRAEESGEL